MKHESLFMKIIGREIPADIVYENDHVIAFRDISPRAPVHILVVPKQWCQDMTDVPADVMGQLAQGVQHVVKQEGLVEAGYRMVVNNGAGVGQTVFHLHLHILSGREFTWPPG